MERQSPARRAARSRRGGALNPIFNVLSGLFLVLTCLSLACVAAVFAVPDLVPAAYRPPTEVALITRPPSLTSTTSTLTPDGGAIPTFPPTWTPTDTPTASPTVPTSTFTPLPTNTEPGPSRTPSITPTPTNTRTPSGPTPTASKTRSPNPWTLQTGSPAYLSNFTNSAGCQYMGIIGQAFDLSGKAVLGYYIHLDGGGLNLDAPTGGKPNIGPGGYEIILGDHPVQTTDTYRIQLRNAAGQPLSDTYVIPTFGDCNRNQILINFVQNH